MEVKLIKSMFGKSRFEFELQLTEGTLKLEYPINEKVTEDNLAKTFFNTETRKIIDLFPGMRNFIIESLQVNSDSYGEHDELIDEIDTWFNKSLDALNDVECELKFN